MVRISRLWAFQMMVNFYTFSSRKDNQSNLSAFGGKYIVLRICCCKILKIIWKKEIKECIPISRDHEKAVEIYWHILRMDNTRHVKKVLKWTPQWTRKPGRSKGTWRRDIAAEIKRHSYTWNQIEKIAKDRTSLRSLVDALYVQNMKRIK